MRRVRTPNAEGKVKSWEAWFSFVLLVTLNVMNYVDRFTPSALKELIKADLNLSDVQTGIVFTCFVVSNIVFSPVFGLLGDLGVLPRRVLIIFGVVAWSVATCLTSLSRSFWTLLIPRLFVGIGESAYGTLGVPLICDLFPKRSHNLLLGIYMCAIPVGSALGYVVSSAIGQRWGWRRAFFFVGLPGVLSILFLIVREPKQGAQEEQSSSEERKGLVSGDSRPIDAESASTSVSALLRGEVPGQRKSFWKGFVDSFRTIFSNGSFAFGLGGTVAATFAAGAVSDWLPAYISRQYSMTPSRAGVVGGGLAVAGGLGGTLAGSLICSHLRKITKQPEFALSLFSMVASAVSAACALLLGHTIALLGFGLFFAATFFFSFQNAPVSVLMNNCLPPGIRSRANGAKILLMHSFGDAISPPIIGFISDHTHGDLRHALLVMPSAIFLAGIVWGIGWRVTDHSESAKSPLIGPATDHPSLESIPEPTTETTTTVLRLCSPPAPVTSGAVTIDDDR